MIYTYEGWKERMISMWQQAIIDADGQLQCPVCEGSGLVEAECPHCGQDTEEDCRSCGGTGNLFNLSDGAPELNPILTVTAYVNAVAQDLIDLHRYTGKINYDDAWSAELYPYCRLEPGAQYLGVRFASWGREHTSAQYPNDTPSAMPPAALERAA